jgi:signal transduction histidine kinase
MDRPAHEIDVPTPRLPRPTIRLRLTLLYGTLFLLASAALLGLAYLAFTTTTLEVNVGPNGQVTVTFGGAFGGGGANTLAAPFGGSAADLPKLLQTVVESQHAAEQQYYLRLSLVALAILAIASVLIGWFVAGRLLRRLRTMSAAARAISSTNLGLRLAPSGPDDELKELGDTFDDLLGRLERSFEAQRQFVANASHELRTPLARQRALVQYALGDDQPSLDGWRSTFERVLAAEEQQERLLGALLTLARGEQGLQRVEPVDLAEVTDAALRSRHQDIEAAGLHLDVHLAPTPVLGDPQLLERLAANLIDNATRYNIPAGVIEVTTEGRLGEAVLRVTNSGPSIPAPDIDRLFEPFQRLPERSARGEGWGLGLSIVRAIVTAHAGVVHARARQAGGLMVEVRIPATSESRLSQTSHTSGAKGTDGHAMEGQP